MDPASLTIGVLALVSQLYTCYQLYISIKDFSPAFRNLRLALQLERERFKLWVECMGIDQTSGINARLRDDAGLLDLIREILTKLKEAFDDSAKVLEEYQEIDNASEIQDHDARPDLARRISPKARQAWDNYSRIVKWATRDKKKLEQLVQILTKYNNDLDHLATTAEQAAMRRRWRTQFVVANQREDLQLVQETAAMMGHDDLYRETSAKAFVQGVYQHEDLCAHLEAMKLKTIVQPKSDLTETIDGWKFDFNNLEYEGVAFMATHSRTLGMYKYDVDRKEPVLVDWSRCRDDSWRRYNKEAFEIRLSNLAQVLNRDLLPKGFRVLQCIGYLHGSSTTIGYMYKPPADAVPGLAPVSLNDVLSKVAKPSDIPELGTRFALARALITIIYEFHNIGWLHKNIQPENILFWHSTGNDGSLDLRKPYLVGFDLSRSNQPGEISEKPIASEGEDLYRHPNYKGDQATGFKPAYDYYSLGVLLFEIANWRLISMTSSKDGGGGNRRKPSLTDPDFVHRTVTGVAQDLGRFVGAKYRDAILAIMQMEFDEVWNTADEAERELALQKAFQSKVIDAIEFCQA